MGLCVVQHSGRESFCCQSSVEILKLYQIGDVPSQGTFCTRWGRQGQTSYPVSSFQTCRQTDRQAEGNDGVFQLMLQGTKAH